MLTDPAIASSRTSTPVSLLKAHGSVLSSAEDSLATEEPLEIRLSYEKAPGLRVTRSISVTMRTPGADPELAAGFLFGEGILRVATDIRAIDVSPKAAPDGLQGNVIDVILQDGVRVELKTLERNFYTSSSCGVCGKTSIEALRLAGGLPPDSDRLTLDLATLASLPDRLRQTQSVFERTGGLHGAGLFDADGRLIVTREDVGRHNAVDKVIGARVLAGQLPAARSILVLSGRASFELMQKALMAGIPVIVAVGAPSSLAVEVARRFGATLLGFVRDGRMNVYAGAHRLIETGAGHAT